jgi:hypothetical protein
MAKKAAAQGAKSLPHFEKAGKISFVAISAYVATRLIMLFGFERYLSDVGFYIEVAKVGIGKNLHAYKDIIWGYPPLSLLGVYAPYYLAQDFESYRFFYQIINVAFDAVAFFYLGKFLCDRLQLGQKVVDRSLIMYALLSFTTGHYIFDRVDIFIVMCFVLALYYLSASDNYKSIIWGALGLVWKVIPVFWLPVVGLFKTQQYKWRGFWMSFLLAVVPAGLFLGIYNWWSQGEMWRNLTLHSDRGIQIESVWATPWMIAKMLNPSLGVIVANTHGAQHLGGAGLWDGYVSLSKILGFLFLAVFYVHLSWRVLKTPYNVEKTADRLRHVQWGFYALSMPLILFLPLQRVLSTTFVIWWIPILAVWWAVTQKHWVAVVSVAIYILTYIGFDIGYFKYVEMQPLYVSVYAMRNVLLVIMAGLFVRDYLRSYSFTNSQK